MTKARITITRPSHLQKQKPHHIRARDTCGYYLVLFLTVESSWNVMAHGDAREGKWRGNWRMEWVASTLTLPRSVVYPALLTLIRTPRLPAVDWTDVPADLNGLVRFGERRNLVSARVPSRFKRSLPKHCTVNYNAPLWHWDLKLLCCSIACPLCSRSDTPLCSDHKCRGDYLTVPDYTLGWNKGGKKRLKPTRGTFRGPSWIFCTVTWNYICETCTVRTICIAGLIIALYICIYVYIYISFSLLETKLQVHSLSCNTLYIWK